MAGKLAGFPDSKICEEKAALLFHPALCALGFGRFPGLSI
jgi:hypothetical protein